MKCTTKAAFKKRESIPPAPCLQSTTLELVTTLRPGASELMECLQCVPLSPPPIFALCQLCQLCAPVAHRQECPSAGGSPSLLSQPPAAFSPRTRSLPRSRRQRTAATQRPQPPKPVDSRSIHARGSRERKTGRGKGVGKGGRGVGGGGTAGVSPNSRCQIRELPRPPPLQPFRRPSGCAPAEASSPQTARRSR